MFIKIAKILGFALIMSIFLGLLGLFEGVGYRISSIREVSFIPHTRLGYADVIFHCDAVFNPILYPYYWMAGYGNVNASFYFAYATEHPQWLMDTSSGVPNMEADSDWYPFGWPPTPEERCETYEMYVLTLGNISNFIVLFTVTLFIEILKMRKLYLAIFGGVVGYALADEIGMIVGMVPGFFVFLLDLISPKFKRFLNNVRNYLWEM